MNLKRIFLYTLIASVALSAAIGIVVVIIGNFGEFETRVLSTTATVTVTSIFGLACGAYLESSGRKLIPTAGIIFALLSAVLWLIMIWSQMHDAKYFGESVITVTLLAASCSLISLLSMARLDSRFLWSRWVAHIAVWALAALILICVWFEIDPSQPGIARTMGVLSIVVGAVTVVTPIFHKLSGGVPSPARIDAEIELLRTRIAELEAQKAAFLTRSHN